MFGDCAQGADAVLQTPIGSLGIYSFFPNQLAAAEWYKFDGRVINGHVEQSFGKSENWKGTRQFLSQTQGSFGINAAEIGYIKSSWLVDLRQSGIRISVEAPAWTQCLPGKELAELELLGMNASSSNGFDSIFHVSKKTGRSDPAGHGWFWTKDGLGFDPDEIVLDHRILGLLPTFNPQSLYADNPGLNWEAVKAAARRDPCPAADTFHRPHTKRLAGLIDDYIDYMRTLTARFEKPPAFSFQWNVNAWWEWGDEQCLDVLHNSHPNAETFKRALQYLEMPCYRDTAILETLIEALCVEARCPSVVYMDTDLTYLTNYALDVLRRNKSILRKYGVAFGVDLADECAEKVGCKLVRTRAGRLQAVQQSPPDSLTENMLYQLSMANKYAFLVESGIIDRSTRVRFQSWSIRPAEAGRTSAESVPGSFANTFLRIIRTNDLPNASLQPHSGSTDSGPR